MGEPDKDYRKRGIERIERALVSRMIVRLNTANCAVRREKRLEIDFLKIDECANLFALVSREIIDSHDRLIISTARFRASRA